MAMRISTAVRDAMINALIAAAGSNALLKVYTGGKTATLGGSEAGNTLLATVTITSWGASSSGVSTCGSITGDSSIDATGTAGHFVITTSGATVVADGTVGVGAGFDLNVGTVSFQAAGTFNVSSGTVTQPAGT